MLVNINNETGLNLNQVECWDFYPDENEIKIYIIGSPSAYEFSNINAIALHMLFTGQFDKYNIKNKFVINLQELFEKVNNE